MAKRATAAGVLMFGDHLTTALAVGGVLILAGSLAGEKPPMPLAEVSPTPA